MKHNKNRIKYTVLLIIGILFVLGTCVFLTIRPDVSAIQEKVASVFASRGQEEVEEEPEEVDEAVEEALAAMSLETKVAQLFIIEPEQITGMSQVIAAGETTKAAIEQYPVGGFIYEEKNLIDPDQTKEMLANVQTYEKSAAGVSAFLAINEEGGSITSLSNNEGFTIEGTLTAQEIGSASDDTKAKEIGNTIGSYLSDLGFNMNLAPVANVLTDENSAMATRVFGSNGETVAANAIAEANALQSKKVLPAVKYFPQELSIDGSSAISQKTADELKEAELVPFVTAIEEGMSVVVLSNTAFPEITGNETPASLSKEIVTDLLREELGFKGLIVTDALNEASVTATNSPAFAAVSAIQAGADVLLMPSDFYSAYNGVLDAVNNGEISEERIDESVRRILDVKMNVLGQ